MTQDNPINDPQNPNEKPPENAPGGQNPTPPPAIPAPRKRRWLRRTLYIVGGLVILLIILLLLVPTIVSSGWVRSIVVNKINQNLNGHVDISGWSLSWWGGIQVNGVKVVDDQNRQILQIPHISTQLSLVSALRGNYDLGQTVVDGLDFNFIRYPDGTSNFSRLTNKPSAPSQPAQQPSQQPAPQQQKPAAEKQKQPSGPMKLPNVSGDIKLANARGTVETITLDPKTHQEQHDLVKVTSIDGEVKIPNINQPITDSLKVVEVAGNSTTPGTLEVNGQIQVAKNNLLLPADQMSGNQQVTLQTIELAGFTPFAPPSVTALAGNTSGKVSVVLTPGQGDTLDGQITSQNFKLGGPILSGDTYIADSAVIDIPKTVITAPAGSSDYHVKIGDGNQQAITLTLNNTVRGQASQSTVKLVVDAGSGALQNLADNKKPGGNGLLRADVDLDLVPLAEMLPHMLHMWDGLHLNSGRLGNTLAVQLTPDQANISQTLAVTNVTGTDAKGKPVKLDPINQSLKLASLGGGGKIPDLRDIALILTTSADPNSGWASVNIQAANIGKIQGQIHAVLENAQQQLGQIIDFGSTKLAGNLDVALTSNGDLLPNPSNPDQSPTSDITVNTTLRNLKIDGLKDKPPVSEPFIGLNLAATLVGGKEAFVQAVNNLKTTLLTGNQNQPSVNATIAGNVDLAKGVNTKDLTYNVVTDLPRVQQEFGAFLSFLSDSHLQIQSGQSTMAGKVAYDGQSANLSDVAVDVKGLDLVKNAGQAAQKVLNGYNLTLRTAANYSSDKATDTTTILVPNFAVSDNVGLLRMESTGGPIKLVTTKGRLQPSAKLHISNTSLPDLQRLMRAFGTEVTAQTQQGSAVTSGVLTGTLDLATASADQIQLVGNFDTNALTITAPQAQGLSNEHVTIALQVRAADDFSQANVDKLDANASFLNAHVGDTVVQLKEGSGPDAKSVSTIDMLRKASVKVDVPSLAKLMAVKDAFSPPPAPPPPASGKPAEPPAPPTTVSKGTMTLTLNANRTGDKLSILPNVAIRDLVLHSADGDEPIGNVDVNAKELALMINPAPASQPAAGAAAPATQPSIMDQVRELQIGALVAQITGAQVIVNGTVQDLAASRKIQNMGIDLTYDASKLWTIILPMLSKKNQQDFKDAKVAGNYTKHIVVWGAYPAVPENAGPNAPKPIKSLSLAGDFTLDQFEGQGITLQKLQLPFVMNSGVAAVAIANKPPGQDMPAPASFNGGTLDLGGLTADLGAEHPRLFAPPNKKLVSNVSLNPAFSHLFGDWINNPMFVGADKAAGQLDITINQCQKFPMDSLASEPSPQNDGVLDMKMSLNRVQLGNPTLQNIAQQIASMGIFGGQTLAIQSLQGDIPNLHVHIERGITTEEMTMTFGEGSRPLNLGGTVAMQTKAMNMTLDMPWQLFGVKNNRQFAFLGDQGLKIPLTGTVEHPQFNAVQAARANLQGAPQDLLKGLLGGNNQGQGQPSSQPSKDNNPINQLEDLFNRNKKKK